MSLKGMARKGHHLLKGIEHLWQLEDPSVSHLT